MSDKLINIFADVLEVEPASLSDDSSPETVREWDSLAAMNLVVELERLFNVRLSTREIMRMASIGMARETLITKGINV